MAYLFGRYSPNVLDALNSDETLDDHFDGGVFDDDDEISNLFGIGKKQRKERKAKRRFERAAKKKYKLETERIRALQGQERSSVVKDIAGGLASVAGSIFGGGQASYVPGQESRNPALENQQNRNAQQNQDYPQNFAPSEPKAKNNTIIYIIVGLIVVGAAFYLLKK